MHEIGIDESRLPSMLHRRRLLCFGTSAAVLAAQPSRYALARTAGAARIGVLYFGDGRLETVGGKPVFDTAMAGLGHRPGTDVIIESRHGTAPDALARHATELVGKKVDVLVALGPGPLHALRAATSSIPIVAVAEWDPVRGGWAKSLARPQGNVTGLTVTHFELQAKELELLKEAFPAIERVAVLFAPTEVSATDVMFPFTLAAPRLGLQLSLIEMRGPSEFEPTLEVARREGVQALSVQSTTMVVANRARLAELAIAHRWPSVSGFSIMAEAGILMTYGPDLLDLIRRSALYVDRILKGASPGELAIERPRKFQLTMNLATARALGMAPAKSVVSRADRLIQ